MTVITVAIDAMGGDLGTSITIPAVVAALKQYPTLRIILVGDEDALRHILSSHRADSSRLTLQHASEEVSMDESPVQALRAKKDSSMRVAINLVKEGRADACVSAGNTGALMATARFVLKTLPGVDRPAIISRLPCANPDRTVRMLDLGANVDSTAEHLLQFAVMGAVLAEAIDEIAHPRVYLLNIGEEDMKGNEQVKKTAQLLSDSHILNYQGFIEGDSIFKGDADVIVSDGFVGNVALKTIEGTITFLFSLLRSGFRRNIFTKFIGALAKPVIRASLKRIDPDKYNGALLIGLNGVVIKSHGHTSVTGFLRAIHEAVLCAEKKIPERIRDQVAHLLTHSDSPKKDE